MEYNSVPNLENHCIYSVPNDPCFVASDIIEGNSKGIMRVILAVAERYQPRSVKQRSSSDAKQFSAYQKEMRDHMTYTLQTDGDLLKRSQSPEATIRGGMSSALTVNSYSVPNMVSMNVSAGGGSGGGGGAAKMSVGRSGSGFKYVHMYLISKVVFE